MKKKVHYKKVAFAVLVAVGLTAAALSLHEPMDSEGPEDLFTGEKPEIDRIDKGKYETATFGVWCFWGPEARLGVEPGVVKTRVGYSVVKGSDRDRNNIKREVVRVDYDPDKISHQELYDLVDETGTTRELNPLGNFSLAEKYNQKYHLGQRENISRSFENIYPDLDDFIDSTAAARLNGYFAGYGDLGSPSDLEGLGLTQTGRERVYNIWASEKR
ncbi:MAG: peptide-methionine (S)-S-oxide reductase [Candidatus Thermoplasmatota archaeon]|nr:peptide-methionine (S)-S-oxide reductase [Candidatus Thermoplasmatota archaeon]